MDPLENDYSKCHNTSESAHSEMSQKPFDEDSDEEIIIKPKRKTLALSDEDDDSRTQHDITNKDDIEEEESNIEHETLTKPNKRVIYRSSIDSDEDSEETTNSPRSPAIKSLRIENKNDKLANKFKNKKLIKKNSNSSSEERSKEDTTSTDVPSKSKIPNLYDSDESDSMNYNECDHPEQDEISLKNDLENLSQSDQNIKEKTQRLSAKQAMEQMQVIKSESSRMLREKRFSLPYHRPKQVSLKDIIKKKKIQFIPGTKKLQLRMTEEQLIEYAKHLEQKEKDMIELYKSESEEETSNFDLNIKAIGDSIEVQTNVKHISESDILLPDKENTNDENFNNKMVSSPDNEKDNTSSLLDTTEKTMIVLEEKEYTESETILDNVGISEHTIHAISELSNKYSENVTLAETGNKEVTPIASDNNKVIPEYDNDFQDEDIHQNKFEPHESQPLNKISSIISSKISCSLPAKPKLSGTPGDFIDLTPNIKEEISGVDILKKKFFFHAAIKTPEEMEREKEKKIQPGTAFMNMKRELETQINKRRLEEWTKKKEEESLKKEYNKSLDDELSECEELLEKETKTYDTKAIEDEPLNENNDSSDETEEEDDVEIKSPKRQEKCDFLDEEAELDDEDYSDDDEDEESDETDKEIVTPHEGKKKLTRIYKAFPDSESSDDDDDTSCKNINGGLLPEIASKSYTTGETNNILSTPVKEINDLKRPGTADLFDSQDAKKNDESFSLDSDDNIPLGQKCTSTSATPVSSANNHTSLENLCNTPVGFNDKNDSSNYISSLIKTRPLESPLLLNNDSPLCTLSRKLPVSPDKWINLQKNLFGENNSTETLGDTQDIAELCSGKFPSQSESISLSSSIKSFSPCFEKDSTKIDMTQNTENELMELCSGKFVGIDSENTDNFELKYESETIPKNPINGDNPETISIENTSMCNKDGHENTNDPSNQVNSASSNVQNEMKSLKSINDAKIIQPLKPKPKTTIKSFFAAKTNKETATLPIKEIIMEKKIDENNKTIDNVVVSSQPMIGKYTILSSDEDEENEDDGIRKNKILKSKAERNKKRKVKPLEMSDEEESEEEPEESDAHSYVEEMNDEELVEYDSEENEVVIQVEEKKEVKKKKTSEFFDGEAELTSEDEWKGSGDEDERGLDELEWEEGDADQIDQRKVTKELERIHRHQMLDQDKREIKLLQDILLEDGDLEGGTRERKFKWKNVDNGIESGAVVGDDQDDAIDEVQSEEQWRRQRHERETFLREMMEKENAEDNSLVNASVQITRTSFIKASLNSSIKLSTLCPIENNAIKSNETNKLDIHLENEANPISSKKSFKDLPSPVKKPLSLIQNNFKGSFLSRGQASLNRLALLAKTGAPQKDDETTNLRSLAPGKHRNFVFTTVSPPCNNEANETSKREKRKLSSEVSTPSLIKKMKIVGESSMKFKKTLFDHIE